MADRKTDRNTENKKSLLAGKHSLPCNTKFSSSHCLVKPCYLAEFTNVAHPQIFIFQVLYIFFVYLPISLFLPL